MPASAELEQVFQVFREQGGGLKTNMTKVVHRTSYPAISPSRPELSHEGRTVLITGGGTGIGLAAAKAFAQAGAHTVIIVGRRAAILADAQEQIQAVTAAGDTITQVKVLTHVCDVTDGPAVATLWADLKAHGVEVDVLVLNAAKFGHVGSLLETGAEVVWSALNANVRGPLLFAEAFYKQDGDRPKSIVNMSTEAIFQLTKEDNMMSHVWSDYSFTKNAGTFAMQLIANFYEPEKLQVVSIHPGVIYSDAHRQADLPRTLLPFDDESLAASATVWAASPEARFLHGRFIWTSWDVDELKTGELRQRIDADPQFLRLGIHGLKGNGDRKF